jgi:thiamine-phosphate pyrophosphorylase
MPTPTCPRRGVYLITRVCIETARLLDVVDAALRAGVAMVQYRDKSAAHAQRLAQAQALVELCNAHGAPLIVNDDIELARSARAHGVHLGRDDAGVAAARATLGPDAIIGVSCYAEIERAREAADAGANYLAFGSFFASPTKPGAVRAAPELLRQAAAFGLPKVAIGGITLDNAPALIAAGADLLATISAVFDAPHAGDAARALVQQFSRES